MAAHGFALHSTGSQWPAGIVTREIRTGRAHRVAQVIAGDSVDLIEVAVDEQHRLRNAAAIGRPARIGDVGVVV